MNIKKGIITEIKRGPEELAELPFSEFSIYNNFSDKIFIKAAISGPSLIVGEANLWPGGTESLIQDPDWDPFSEDPVKFKYVGWWIPLNIITTNLVATSGVPNKGDSVIITTLAFRPLTGDMDFYADMFKVEQPPSTVSKVNNWDMVLPYLV